jgi:hypothetical protein
MGGPRKSCAKAEVRVQFFCRTSTLPVECAAGPWDRPESY